MQNTVVRTVIAISIGALPGAILRYLITELIITMFGTDFSYYGTFFINVTGCWMIALFYSLNEKRFNNLPAEYRLAIATGFCGSYTTFSTYGLETVIQLDQDNTTVALVYWLGSIVLGMVGVRLGVK